MGGRQIRFNIAGSASTPEYAYTIAEITDFLPDPAKFNFAFAAEKPLNNYLGTPHIYNSICIELVNGYSFDDVADSIRDELQEYGLTSLYKQADQPSTLFINMEITGISSMSAVLPMAFCGLTVIILYLMLKRVIEQDRTQIGVLKAFGFGNAQIVGHYIFYGLLTGGLGSLIGAGSGFLISGVLSEVMRMFFNLPEVRSVIDMLPILLTGIFAGLASGGLGAFMGASRVIRLPPAEAMKPEAPRVTKHDPLRFIPGVRRLLTSTGSMAVRNITRAKFRSFFIIMSIGVSFGILAFFGSYPTMIDSLLLNQYTKSEVYDIKVSFRTPRSVDAAEEEMKRFNGVRGAEALLELPVTLINNDRRSGAILAGIPSGSRMCRIFDEKAKVYYPPPKEGLILSATLAETLNASVGDRVTVKSPYVNEDIKLIVAGLATRAMGGVYMERDALADAFHMKGQSTSVVIMADDISYIKEKLKEGGNIASVTDAAESAAGLEAYTGLIDSMLVTYFIFGVAIAFAIIYNTSTISFSERRREFATLRVLGMTIPEINSIQAFEYWTLTFFGILLGIPFTMMIKQGLNVMIDMETIAFPEYTAPHEYFIGFLGVVAAVFISNRVSRRKIGKLDMVLSLKDME
jgi:putative ABC transport system permease protein